MAIRGVASMHLDSQLDELFQRASDTESLGRLFAGCVAYLDHAEDSNETVRFLDYWS